MAEETLDAAIKAHGLSSEPCKTVGLMLEGAKGWTPTLYIRLVQDYGLENEVRTRGPVLPPRRAADPHAVFFRGADISARVQKHTSCCTVYQRLDTLIHIRCSPLSNN